MPRKAFNADIEAATTSSIPGVSNVLKGGDDGSIYATYTSDSGVPIEIELMVQPGKP